MYTRNFCFTMKGYGKIDMFYLLPHLNVSIFMVTVWNYFWRVRDTYILCIALVINEQSYLEQRVIQNPHYQKEVLNKIEFHLQNWLSFNQILFPSEGENVKGQTLHQFQSLHERILLGKRLYHFPHRLLPEIFSIHIVFTLIGLPILTMVFLYSLSQVNRWGKAGIILFVSLLMPVFEKIAERLGGGCPFR